MVVATSISLRTTADSRIEKKIKKKIKKRRRRRKRFYILFNFYLQFTKAVAIWPVTGQGFQNTK